MTKDDMQKRLNEKKIACCREGEDTFKKWADIYSRYWANIYRLSGGYHPRQTREKLTEPVNSLCEEILGDKNGGD
jgi:hypothetical protein